jgi:hypothetical protein
MTAKPARISRLCSNGCGTYVRRHTLDPNPQWQCRRCTKDPTRAAKARADAEAREAARIDWYAVEVACTEGHRMTLNPAEARIAVRRLSPRMLGQRDNSTDIAPWRLTAQQVANRIGTTPENAAKILHRLPAATRQRCPECRGDMWVLDATGTVEEHGNLTAEDGWERCPTSGRAATEPPTHRIDVRHHPVPQARLALRLVNA